MKRRAWRALPLDDWPAQDRAAWAKALQPGGPLDHGGAASNLAPATRKSMQALYAQVLFWLRDRGELDARLGPADRMTHARFVAYIGERRAAAVSDNTVFNNLRMVAMMLKCLAPEKDWTWLYRHPLAPRRHEALLARRSVPLVKPRLLFVAVRTALDDTLSKPISKQRAVGLRNFLIVAIAATTALRLRSLVALTLNESMLRHGYGYEIRCSASSMKNARAISLQVMPELTEALDSYVTTYRPLLFGRCPPHHDALWVSHEGSRLSDVSMYEVFMKVTPELTGRKVHPHALRHSAVSDWLAEQPLETEVASALLAHRDSSTVSVFYDLSGRVHADQVWTDIYERLRRLSKDNA